MREDNRRMRSRVSLTVILFTAVAFAAVARAGVKESGPAVGSRVPQFKALDQFGNELTPASLVGARGAVLLFFRSADW